jgi:hypothetical protein
VPNADISLHSRLEDIMIALYGTMLRRDLTSGKLPKDGYLLGDMELRQIIEAFAEDSAIFLAVRAYLFPYHNFSCVIFSSRPQGCSLCTWISFLSLI